MFGVLPRGRAYEMAMGASCKSRSWELVYARAFTDHITLFQAQKREMKDSRMSERVTAGLISMIDTFKYIANAVTRDRETTRRETRHIRIRKWYKDNIGWDYAGDLFGENEAERLRNLAAAARSASWGESSDGEEEKDDTESRRKEKGRKLRA